MGKKKKIDLNLDESTSSRKKSKMNNNKRHRIWKDLEWNKQTERHTNLEENNVQARLWELIFLIVRQL
jgi:hypothetical protein